MCLFIGSTSIPTQFNFLFKVFHFSVFNINPEPGIMPNMMGFIITPSAIVPATIKKVDDKIA